MERRREGADPRLAANLIVSQFVLPPEGWRAARDSPSTR